MFEKRVISWPGMLVIYLGRLPLAMYLQSSLTSDKCPALHLYTGENRKQLNVCSYRVQSIHCWVSPGVRKFLFKRGRFGTRPQLTITYTHTCTCTQCTIPRTYQAVYRCVPWGMLCPFSRPSGFDGVLQSNVGSLRSTRSISTALKKACLLYTSDAADE